MPISYSRYDDLLISLPKYLCICHFSFSPALICTFMISHLNYLSSLLLMGLLPFSFPPVIRRPALPKWPV